MQSHGGYVAKYLGDGVLSYFGYPEAAEDEAERAVRAALELVEATDALESEPGEPLQARVGMATGLVVIGDIVGEGVSEERAVSGETPNIASRLEILAAPGEVVISHGTRSLIGGLFDVEDLGPQELAGVSGSVLAWKVTGERQVTSRFEARHAGSLTPFVGRNEDLYVLERRWAYAKEGEGQVVVISGEPGIGKSRLIQEVRERIANDRPTRVRYQCSPHHTSSAFYPFIAQLTFAARIAAVESSETKLDKLEALLGQATDGVAQVTPLFADLLAIPTNDRYPQLNYTPQRQKEETLAALLDQLAGLAAQQPVLMVFEDAHWIDPTSQELLDLIVERVRELPVLVLITFRPEYTPPWVGQAQVTALTLNRLGRRQSAAMVANVAGAGALPQAVREEVAARTEGVPLFVEELTKAVLEAGPCAPDSTTVSALQVPATLQDSLMARLDRLGPAKEVAQLGAVIGRNFDFALLAAVADTGEEDLRSATEALVHAEPVLQHGTPPKARYTFKHALVQDAAYESLLRARRRESHARVAQVLNDRFPETAGSQPELLAHHFTEAGLSEQAVGFWQIAGEQAAARSANEEALNHAQRGLALVDAIGSDDARMRTELALQVILSNALLARRGFGAPETGEAFERAYALCQRVEDAERVFPILVGLHAYHDVSAEHRMSREIGKKAYELAQKSDDRASMITALFLRGINHWFPPDLPKALEYLERLEELHDVEGPLISVSLFGEEPGLCSGWKAAGIGALVPLLPSCLALPGDSVPSTWDCRCVSLPPAPSVTSGYQGLAQIMTRSRLGWAQFWRSRADCSGASQCVPFFGGMVPGSGSLAAASTHCRKRQRVSASAACQARWSAGKPAAIVDLRVRRLVRPLPSSMARAFSNVAGPPGAPQRPAITRCWAVGMRARRWRSPSRSASGLSASATAASSHNPSPISSAR